MHILNLFTISIVTVWLVGFRSLQATKRRLEPIRVSYKK